MFCLNKIVPFWEFFSAKLASLVKLYVSLVLSLASLSSISLLSEVTCCGRFVELGNWAAKACFSDLRGLLEWALLTSVFFLMPVITILALELIGALMLSMLFSCVRSGSNTGLSWQNSAGSMFCYKRWMRKIQLPCY